MARAALTRVDPPSFLAALERAAGAAATAFGGFEDHFHRVGGLPVRLRFAGPALVSHLTRAMAHLGCPPAPDPPLTIDVWDSESTHAPPPWPGGEGRVERGYFGDGDRGFFQWGEGSLTVLDAGRGRGWYWVRSATHRPGPDRAAPLSSILRSWLAEREIQLVHAAGVGTGKGCVLLVGGGGAGKSSAALACVAAGLRCLGDDTCLIGPGDPPRVLSLYSSAQADPAMLERLPFLEGDPLHRKEGGKGLAFLSERALLLEAPLRALAIASVCSRSETRVRPASAREALAAIAPTSILRMPGPGQSTLTRLGRVLEGTACHHLEVGSDPGRLADAVKGLL